MKTFDEVMDGVEVDLEAENADTLCKAALERQARFQSLGNEIARNPRFKQYMLARLERSAIEPEQFVVDLCTNVFINGVFFGMEMEKIEP